MGNFLGIGRKNMRLTHLRGEMTVKDKDTALLRTFVLNLMRYSQRVSFAIVLGISNIDDNGWKAFLARSLTSLRRFCKPALGDISCASERLGHLRLSLCSRLDPKRAILGHLAIGACMRVKYIAHNRYGASL